MATIDFVVKNGLTVTEKTTIQSTTDASSATDTAASLNAAGGAAIAKKLYVGTDLQAAGTTINLGTSTSTLTTATVGGAITGNILKVAGTAAGTINLTTDVTTGIVNEWASITTGTINIGVGSGASIVNLAGVGGSVNIGTTGANSTLTIRGNATTGTATLATSSGVTTANVFNTIATTGNLFGAATTVSIGATTGTLTLNNASVTTPGQLVLTGGNNTATGGGQLYLNGATGNRIDFNINGTAAPAFTTRSVGAKIVLYPNISASAADYAFGIDTSTLWSGVPDTSGSFKWYAGTTLVGTLAGTGDLIIPTTVRSPVITTNSAANITISTNNGSNSGTILINNGVNGNITVTPNGSGNIGLVTSTVLQGILNTATTLTTNGTANLTLSTNSGTNSGSVLINNGANGNIDITTNGSGKVDLITSTTQLGVSNTASTLTTNGTSTLTINTNNGTNTGAIVLNNGVNGNITAVTNGTGKIGFFTTSPVSKFTVQSAGGTAPTIAFPDATNNRYNAGIGSRQVTNIGQIMDFYSGDSTANGTDLSSTHIRQTIMPNGFVGINNSAPEALLNVRNATNVNANYNTSTVSAMDATLDTITFSAVHNLTTGDMVFYLAGSGGPIGGINGTAGSSTWQYMYYAQVIDTTTIKLHTTAYNAQAQGTAIDLTGTLPAGTHTFKKGVEWSKFNGSNGNATYLHTFHYRHTDGADWTGDSTRIQQRIDTTPQGFIEFNPPGTQGGIAFGGTSPNGETFRIGSTSLILGNGDTALAAVNRTIRMTNMAGTDVTAGTMSIIGSLATGAGLSGKIGFSTGTTSTTGAVLQTATERLYIAPSAAATTLDLVTAMTTANVLNSAVTTMNFGGVATSVNVGTSAAAASTLTFGPAITANTFKIGSVAAGTINLTSDVTTGIINAYTGVTTGTVNIATGGASTTNIGGAAAVLNIGTTAGDSIIELRGNATTGTATLRTTAGVTTANVFNTVATTGNLFGLASTVNVGTSAAAAATLTFGPAITANTFKIGSTASGTVNLTSDVTTGIVNAYTGITTGTVNIATGGASTTNIGGAAAVLNLGTTAGDSVFELRGNATTGTATLRTNTGVTTANVFNTFATTGNLFGAATTIAVGTTSGTITLSNPTVVGTQTTVNLWNTTSTTGNVLGVATAVNLGINAASLSTLTFGPAITGNIFKIGSTAAGTINLTSDVTTGIVNEWTGITTGTLNLATGGASTTNIGGAAAAVNIGTTGGDSTLTVRGNATTGTATLATNAATANVFNANATTVNIAGAGTAIAIGAATGTVTIANPTVTMSNTSTTLNMNGTAPAIASTATGTASIFNANITAINFGQAAAISMGATTLNTTVRGNFLVNGNTTIGDASSDTVTYNANSATVPNTYTFTLDDATNANIGYPIKFSHTTSGTAAVGIGTGVQFITENAAGTAIAGAYIESVATNVTAAAEAFDLVLKTMTAGATPAQALRVNNNTVTVGAANATTITTQATANLTIQPGATGATSPGTTLTVSAGAGGSTSGAGGAATFQSGNATLLGAGGIATFKSGAAVGTNQTGAITYVEAGNGTGTGGSGSIVFRTAAPGSTGAVANTLVNALTITNTGAMSLLSDLTVGGNLIVNGTLTTINSSTVTVDDKNIELASVAIVTGLTVTITAGSAVITFIGASTSAGLLAGQTLTITSTQSGAPVLGGGAVIQTVDSLTQVTMTVVATGTTGNATVSSSGATDASADNGGITILGTTNKTWNYINANTAWTSNQNVDIATTKTYKVAATDVLSASAVLQNATAASIGSLAAAATVSIGAATQNNILNINGNTTAGTATLTTNVTTGTVTVFDGLTGTLNLANNAATAINFANTTSAAQTVNMFGGSTAASTYNIAHGATAGVTKTINIGTAGTSGSTTNITLGSGVSGALGTTTINGTAINIGTNSLTAVTATVGSAVGGNTIRIAGIAGGIINLTSDVTTGTVNLYTGVTTGAVNIATGGASSIVLGGAGSGTTIGTIAGNSTLTINANGTTGTATLTTNVTSGTVNEWQSVVGTINFGSSGAINLGTSTTAVTTAKIGGAYTGNILKIASTAGGTINLTTDVTTGVVNLFQSLTTATVNLGTTGAGTLAIAFNKASTSTTTGAVTIAGGLGVNGAVNALTKSFIIPHPTKPNMLLKHGSLEGPEFGVYVRGKATSKIIELPDYWTGLVDEDTITVDLTPIGKHQKLYVEKIEGNKVYINNDGLFSGSISCFYTVWGERKDVGKLDIEAEIE